MPSLGSVCLSGTGTEQSIGNRSFSQLLARTGRGRLQLTLGLGIPFNIRDILDAVLTYLLWNTYEQLFYDDDARESAKETILRQTPRFMPV